MDPWTIAYLIIAVALSVALAPKPPKPKPASLDDFDVPTAEEGRPVPVVFGTVRITGANVLWYGDLKTKKLKKSSLFGSTTIGYQYYMGFHFGLCHGPVDSFTKFEAGDKTAWSGTITASSAGFSNIASVNQPKLFGGNKKEGGLVGDLMVRMGEATQVADGYLSGKIGTPMPAFRGIMSLVWKANLAQAILGFSSGYVGTSPYVKPFAFTVKRVAKGWLNDAVWYSAKAAIGAGMNPAHIVYQTLTDPEWGMGLPADRIDSATFTAAADTLHAEGFGLSLMWNQQSSVEDFLSEVLNHCAGILSFDRSTGKYRFTLIRADYVAASLPLYGPSTISRLESFQRQAWGETVNELTLAFTDPATLKSTAVTAHDLANVRAQGVRVSTKVDYPGITDAAIAQKVALRELAARSTPLAKVSFSVNRDLWATRKGDVVKFEWPALGVSEMVLRVLRVSQGSLASGELEVEGIEDVFALAFSAYTSQPAPGGAPADATYEDDDDTAGPSVISATTTDPPGTPADGDTYLVPTGATGVWAAHVGEVATWNEEDAIWVFSAVAPGTVVTETTGGTQVQTVAGGTAVPYTPIQTTGKIIFGTAISPAAIGSDVNDYAPTGLLTSSGVRLTSGAAQNITGLAAGAGGQILLVHNVGSFDLTLKDESASSAAANRFALNADVTLKADQSTLLQYDATSTRWRVIGGTGSGGGASVTTTKGDLIVRGASTDERLAVGVPGQVLTPDTAAATGVKWGVQTPSNAPDDGATVTRSTDQAVAATTYVAISFSAASRDNSGYWSAGQPTRLTVPRSGWYAISGGVHWGTDNVSPTVFISKNGSSSTVANRLAVSGPGSSGSSARHSLSCVAYLAAGDYVLLEAYATGAATITGAQVPAVFSIHRLGTTVTFNDPGVLHVRDEKTSGTYAGASIAGVQTRVLNTAVVNTLSGASLASNQITLPAGTYDVVGRAPGHQCDAHQAYLYNVTDAAIALLGSSARSRQTSSTDGSSDSVVQGQITITSTKVFELRHYTAAAQATNGLGSIVSSGNVEVYASLIVRVVAGTAARKIVRGAQWFAAAGNLSNAVNKVSVHFPRAATIKAARLLGGTAAGSAVVNAYKNTFAGWGAGSDGSSIVASAKPTLASARTYVDTTLTGWTTAILAGDVLTFQIESVSNLNQLSLQLEIDEAQS